MTIAEEVEKIAGEIDCTSAQVAISWIRQRRNTGVVIPIVGARKLTQLEDNLAALDVLVLGIWRA